MVSDILMKNSYEKFLKRTFGNYEQYFSIQKTQVDFRFLINVWY